MKRKKITQKVFTVSSILQLLIMYCFFIEFQLNFEQLKKKLDDEFLEKENLNIKLKTLHAKHESANKNYKIVNCFIFKCFTSI